MEEQPPAVDATVSSGILLTGQAVTNWYHWTINVLPKAYIANQLLELDSDLPFLVPREIQGTRLEELLALVNGLSRDVVFIDSETFLVENAYVIESPARENYRPKNLLTRVNWKVLGEFNLEIMSQYRKWLLSRADIAKVKPKSAFPRRIFLKRHLSHRPYNQGEVESLLSHFNFESIALEALPAAHQIKMLQSADFVIGPTGAQWTSWFFSEGAIGVVIEPRFLGASSLFAKLGDFGRSQLYEFHMDSEHKGWNDYSYSNIRTYVDINKLERLVFQMLERPT